MNTLIVGCSFVEELQQQQISFSKTPCKLIGRPGAGNALLAQIVLDEVAKTPPNRVIVLWSGINRIDVTVGTELAQLARSYRRWITVVDGVTWASAGGTSGSWQRLAPFELQQVFKTHYIENSQKYFTNRTLTSIILVQNLLKVQGIDCQMSFIYDPTQPTEDFLDHTLGTLDTESVLYNLVDWTKFQHQTAPLYNWAREQNGLQNDQFHPRPELTIEWLNTNFGLGLVH